MATEFFREITNRSMEQPCPQQKAERKRISRLIRLEGSEAEVISQRGSLCESPCGMELDNKGVAMCFERLVTVSRC